MYEPQQWLYFYINYFCILLSSTVCQSGVNVSFLSNHLHMYQVELETIFHFVIIYIFFSYLCIENIVQLIIKIDKYEKGPVYFQDVFK